jgi:hypothetical protein
MFVGRLAESITEDGDTSRLLKVVVPRGPATTAFELQDIVKVRLPRVNPRIRAEACLVLVSRQAEELLLKQQQLLSEDLRPLTIDNVHHVLKTVRPKTEVIVSYTESDNEEGPALDEIVAVSDVLPGVIVLSPLMWALELIVAKLKEKEQEASCATH